MRTLGIKLRALGCTAAALIAVGGIVQASFAAGSARHAGASDQLKPEKLPWGDDPPMGPALARSAALADLGRKLFTDPILSGSGAMACSSCHDPANHFAAANGLSVQKGGLHLEQQGTRAVPSLTYAASTPFFSEHYYESDDDGNESIDEGPTGGRTWDGRVDRMRDQAAIPLLAPNEMANPNESSLVKRISRSAYASEIRRLYGRNIFEDPHKAFAVIGEALEAYQQTPAQFSPFTSKYDAFLRGQAQLTAQELRGLAAFNDPERGNCNLCHRSQLTALGHLPMFTDFGLIAVGVPRNPAIKANSDPGYFDLGACGPFRKDLAGRTEFCGLFKTPSLRNVATRKAFYHNGVFHTLEDAVAFYATRDTNPEKWYPVAADGSVRKFDDLPEAYHANVDINPPFGGHPGDKPRISPEDVNDIVAFLKTLTDGFTDYGRVARLGQP